MAKKAAKETSMPLVIALILFVLTTIAFGVLWYTEFAEKEARAAAVVEANKKVSAATTLVRDAELNTQLYRIFLGVDEEGERVKFLEEQKAAPEKLANELKRINDALAKKMGLEDGSKLPTELQVWKPGDNGKITETPTTSFIEVVGTALNERDRSVANEKKNFALYDDAKTKYEAAVKLLDDARTQFAAVAKALPGDFQTKLDAEIKKFEARKVLFTQAEAKSRKDIDELNDEKGKLEREDKRKKELIGALQEQISIQAAELARRQVNAFQFEEPQGKILRRLPEGVVEINIGSSSFVRPGLTFTVLPNDFPEKGRQSRIRVMRIPDERGNYKNVERFTEKATIEVIEVLSPTLSRARISQEYDPIRDGAAPGDLIYNSVWRKGAADHIALVGIFDVNGDGSDDIESVVRDLNRMGVPVDAYFDMKQRKWVGNITEQTRYIVEGWYPANTAGDPNRDDKTKLIAAMSDAIKAGKEKGVATVKFQDFFPRMGYRVRLDLPIDKLNQATAPYLNRVNAVEMPMNPGN
jgi:hypothetical protein